MAPVARLSLLVIGDGTGIGDAVSLFNGGEP